MSELLEKFKQHLRENEESYKNGARDSIEYPLGYEEVKLLLNEIERLNNIINELEKSKEKQINEYEILILKIERYLNCYQYFLETQEENNKKIANMIHEFSLKDSDE